MKTYELIKVQEATGKKIEQVVMPQMFVRDAKNYAGSFAIAPVYVLLFNADDEQIHHTRCDSNEELSALINNVDVRYVYETDTQTFYKVVSK